MNIKEKVTDLIRSRKTGLPTLPVVVNNIIVTARSERTSAKDLADLIITDQAISARVLRLANSAYNGMPQRIDTVGRAIVIIGFKEIISLALGMGVFSALSKKGGETLIDMAELWKHAIGVGFAAKKIAKKIRLIADETTILTGLLHDIGKIIFCVYFPNEYAEVLKKTANEQTPLHEIEKECLGLDHAEMAYLLMKQWNLPVNLIQPVRYHHNPSACPKEQVDMAMIVYAANFICHQSGIGRSGNNNIETDNKILGKLELSDENIRTLAEELESEQDKVEAFLTALS
ncbi:MAG: HDOD domain-containing protein [Desulfobacterales bacterium]|nr:HDOD domain-containing protein [Desulfobacterales bacterium]